MKSKGFNASVAIIALSAAASMSPALAQSGKPGLYAFHTGPAVGGCPGLDWHINLEPDNSLNGFVAWDGGQHMAKLAGSLNKDRDFEMDLQEVGGAGKKGTVKGRAAGSFINVVIDGTGSPCDGINLSIPRLGGG